MPLPPMLSTEGIGCESVSEQLFGLGGPKSSLQAWVASSLHWRHVPKRSHRAKYPGRCQAAVGALQTLGSTSQATTVPEPNRIEANSQADFLLEKKPLFSQILSNCSQPEPQSCSMKERKAGNDSPTPFNCLSWGGGDKGDFNEGGGPLSQEDAQKQVPWAALLLRAKPRRVQAAKSYPSVQIPIPPTVITYERDRHQGTSWRVTAVLGNNWLP